jgi:hypothetical protein
MAAAIVQRLASFDARGGQAACGVRHCMQCSATCGGRPPCQRGTAACRAAWAVPHGRLCRTGLRLRQRRRHAMVHIIKVFLTEVSEAVGMAAWHVTRGMAHVTRHAAWHVLHTSRDGFLQGASASHRIASHRIAVTRMRAQCAIRTNATLPRCRVQACGMSQHAMAWHGMAGRQRTASATGGVPTSPRCDVHAHVGWGRTTPCRAGPHEIMPRERLMLGGRRRR